MGRARALEICHGGKEKTHVEGREDKLIACDAGDDGAVLGREVYTADEELEPFCCGGSEYDCEKGLDFVIRGDRVMFLPPPYAAMRPVRA